MKRLRNIPTNDKGDLIYGESNPENGEIHVNIQYIWEKYPHFNRFVKEFCGTYSHELLHLLIYEELQERRRTILGEEHIIRYLLHEPFTKRLKEYYRAWGRTRKNYGKKVGRTNN